MPDTAVVVIIFVIAISWVHRYRKAPPNKALLISGGIGQSIRLSDGRQIQVGFRIVYPGRGTFVWPVFERLDVLSLETLPVEGRLRSPTPAGGPGLIYRAQVKIGSDEASIALAAERFLSKQPDEIAAVAGQLLDDGFRRSLARTPAGERLGDLAVLADQLRGSVASVLAGRGLVLEHLGVEEAPEEAPRSCR